MCLKTECVEQRTGLVTPHMGGMIRAISRRIGQRWKATRVPAEDLEEFNTHIVGKITIEAAYYGEGFKGEVNPETNLPVNIDDCMIDDGTTHRQS